jgi:hypothetical protein
MGPLQEAGAQRIPEPGIIQVDERLRFREKGLGPYLSRPL